MAKIELKKPIVDEISAVLDGAKTAVLVDARGLTVAEDTELRKALRENGVQYKVYKNTFIRLASKGTVFEAMDDLLNGPTALAVSKDDATVAARELAKFAKTHKALEIKGGMVEDKFCSAEEIQVVSQIPSREILLGRLLGSMQSPITNFARVLKQIAEKDSESAAE